MRILFIVLRSWGVFVLIFFRIYKKIFIICRGTRFIIRCLHSYIGQHFVHKKICYSLFFFNKIMLLFLLIWCLISIVLWDSLSSWILRFIYQWPRIIFGIWTFVLLYFIGLSVRLWIINYLRIYYIDINPLKLILN